LKKRIVTVRRKNEDSDKEQDKLSRKTHGDKRFFTGGHEITNLEQLRK
jgi:hypothetical protein